MSNIIINGNSTTEVCEQLDKYFANYPEPLEIELTILHPPHKIEILVDIDLGGGFEGGYESTVISAALPSNSDYRFGIHHEHFTDEIGKFFGMQDVQLGYETFDKKVIVKTNDTDTTRALFDNPDLRSYFGELDNFNLGITVHNGDEGKLRLLKLEIEEGLNDAAALKEAYQAFKTVLDKVSGL